MCSETGDPEVTGVGSFILPNARTMQRSRKLSRLKTISSDIVPIVEDSIAVVDGERRVGMPTLPSIPGEPISIPDDGSYSMAQQCKRDEGYGLEESRIEEVSAVHTKELGRHMLEGSDPVGGQEQHDVRGARVSFEFESKDEDTSASNRRKSRFSTVLGTKSPDGRRSPGLVEKKSGQSTPESRSWPGAGSPAAQMLRRLEDYDDRVYWSDSAEDFITTTPDVLSKVEEIAEEIYREALEMHFRLSSQSDLTDARDAAAVSGVSPGSSEAETKETCGAITYSSPRPTYVSEMLGEKLLLSEVQGQEDSHNVPPDIPQVKSETRSLSFSLPTQCNCRADMKTLEGKGDEAKWNGDVQATPTKFQDESSKDRSENAVRETMIAGPSEVNQDGGTSLEFIRTKFKTFDNYRDLEKAAEFKNAVDKELDRLRESNLKKQAKIDSLQKWRTYYQKKIEDKDKMLEEMDIAYTAELKKKDKGLRKTTKSLSKEIALRGAKHEEVEMGLRAEMQELNLVIEELSKQLYDMEEHFAKEGIPYVPRDDDAGPSSKILLSAVLSVKECAHTFTRTFMSYLKQHPTESRDLEEQIRLESEVLIARPADFKFLVQSFICRRMFLDFDSECFNLDSCMTEILDTEEHSKACFKEYMCHKKISDTVTVLTDNRQHSPFLREFCFKKFLSIVSESTEEAFFGDYNHSDDIFNGRHPSSRFYESFCKLAVSVWLLHRLAFSFQPPARMIPVKKGAKFHPKYMESAVPGIFGDDGDDEEGSGPMDALVGLMVHPGFRVGNSIIRAQVYLVSS